jgi:SPP1 family phage portal protein
MFSKQQRSTYRNTNGPGSTYLQNAVRTRIYSGDEETERRLTAYQLYWQFYVGRHWNENNDKLISFNYCKAIVDKVTTFMVGKNGCEFNIEDTWGDEIDGELVEKPLEALVNYVWRKNRKKLTLTKALQMGSVSGDLYLFLYPDMQKGYVVIDVLDSRTTLPIFKDGDQSRVDRYRVVKPLGENDKKYAAKVTEYSNTERKTYFVKDVSEKAEKFEVETEANSLGFIPIIHIQNAPNSAGFGGFSDLVDILKLNKIYNEMAEDVKQIIDYYAAPTTVITGATVGSLKRGVDQIWSGLPAEADVKVLSLGEDLAASQNFLQTLKNAMHDMSGVPEEVLSKVQHISNTSAAALQMLYQSLIQAADKKATTYGEGLVEVNKMICVMMVNYFQDSLDIVNRLPQNAKEKPTEYFERFWICPAFVYDLPNDRLMQLQEAQLELTLKVGSRQEVMERLGKRNIPMIFSQINEDLEFLKKVTEAQTPTTPPVQQGGGGGSGGNPAQ